MPFYMKHATFILLCMQKDETALMYSIRGQHVEVCKKLLQSGIDVTTRDKV